MVTAVAAVSPIHGAGARGRPTPTISPTKAPTTTHTTRPATAATLRTRAAQAAARYATARAEHARLGDRVAALERQVADLEARIRPLREQITRQAVAVYQRDVAAAAVSEFEAVAAMMRSDRAARLVSDLTARHMPALDTLLQARQHLHDRQAELAARRHDQEKTMADVSAQREQISAELQALAATTPPRVARRPSARASRSAPRLGQRFSRPAPAAAAAGFVCPIDGPLTFSDDFGAPRGGGRRHMGNDLLSPRGTANVAVVDGTIETKPWAGGGITIFLHGDDGHTYIYMHLMRIEGAVPRQVVQGELIGLTGNTGHSYGYHTHFEYHPNGGVAVSPYPLLSAACT